MDKYAVFGNPISQSKSPFIHAEFAKQTHQELEYNAIEPEESMFREAINALIAAGGKGANVTAPFKEQAMAMSDVLSEKAQLAGAVNTLSFIDGKIYGDTTDGIGLVNDLLANHVKLEGARVLLLGAGGAAKGVVKALLEQQTESLDIANRTLSKATAIAGQYEQNSVNGISFEQANSATYDVIVNATSAGLSGQGVPISEKLITPETICYDMTYGKNPTPFLKLAEQQNAKQIIDGLGMLVGQAAASFEIWRGVMPETKAVLKQLRVELT